MKNWNKTTGRLLGLAAVICPLSGLMLASCEMDAYDKGEGEYSLMTAEMVDAHVGSDKYVDYVETDQGDRLNMDPHFTVKWIDTADTTYRAILYYNQTEAGKATTVSMSKVGVLPPQDSVRGGIKTDPMHIESIWMSKNRKYLNLRMRLMTGATDDEDARQKIGLVNDKEASTDNHARLLLCHDQGGQPEYYSATSYASIPLAGIEADTLTLTINTYDGMIDRTFVVGE